MNNIKEMIENKTNEIFDEVVALRRHIHANPELEFEEIATSELVCSKLDEMGIEYEKNIAKTGVCAIIRGREDNGKTLLIRADMDALPLKEETNLEYKSAKDGIMHACGHDAHTAMLLGCAKVLNSMKDTFCGNVKLVFQPAEEGSGGAQPMINEGVLKNPDVTAAIALHVWPELEAGAYMSRYDAIMASPDDFVLKIIGRGGHGGKPEEAINPLDIAAEIAIKLKNIPDKLFGEDRKAVVTVCRISGGTTTNVIPDSAEVMATFRTLEPLAREKTGNEIERVIKETVLAYGAEYELKMNYLYPPTMNDKNMVDMLSDLDVDLSFKWLDKPSMSGEDFAFFAQSVPSVLCYIGTRNPDDESTHYPLHSPHFAIDENAMANGIKVLSSFAVKYLME